MLFPRGLFEAYKKSVQPSVGSYIIRNKCKAIKLQVAKSL